MKTHPSLLFAPMSVVLALFVLVLSGCASSPKQAAYKSLAAIGQSEAAAMRAAATLEVQGKLGSGAWAKIENAHEKYLPAYAAAVRAAQYDYEQPASSLVLQLAQDVLNLVSIYAPK